MRCFDWLFRKRVGPGQQVKKRYEYPTGNLETVMRVKRGEFLMNVSEDVRPRWTPGNEYLWDEYDPESLIDSPENLQYLVNQLLFCRMTLHRALRNAGHDIRGQDPFNFTDEVPKVLQKLESKFPDVFDGQGFRGVEVKKTPLELSPDDPGLPTDNTQEDDQKSTGDDTGRKD